MCVLTRLRRAWRGSAALLALVTLLGAASVTLHTHPGDATEREFGPATRIPVSVIAEPDAPSPSEHLHSGSTFAAETCPACVLSTAHGVPLTMAVAPVATPFLTVAVMTPLRPFAAAPTRHPSRSPPTSA